jgi:hypothetical protein
MVETTTEQNKLSADSRGVWKDARSTKDRQGQEGRLRERQHGQETKERILLAGAFSWMDVNKRAARNESVSA